VPIVPLLSALIQVRYRCKCLPRKQLRYLLTYFDRVYWQESTENGLPLLPEMLAAAESLRAASATSLSLAGTTTFIEVAPLKAGNGADVQHSPAGTEKLALCPSRLCYLVVSLYSEVLEWMPNPDDQVT
jgi:hypothetical protein